MSRHSRGTDRSLVSALRAKADDAVADVYDLHAEALYGYVCGFVGSSTASDVVHDAVWIATERIRTLRDPDMFRPWLYAIARSECVRTSTGSSGYIPAGPEAGSGDDADTAVLSPVHALDPTDLEAVDLTVRHGFTEREVAAIIGSGFDVGVALECARTSSTDPAGQIARLPTTPPPPYLRSRLLTAPPSAEERTAMGRRIDPVDRGGFPTSGQPRRTIVAWGASAAGVAVLVAVALFAFVDRAPAEQHVPSPSDATLRLDLGDYVQSTTAPVTTAPATTAPDTGTTTIAPNTVATTEATVTETSSPETTTADPSSTAETAPTTTETGWSSRRDRSRDDDSDDDESEPTETDESSGGGNSGGSGPTNTAPPLFTFEPGPFGRSGE